MSKIVIDVDKSFHDAVKIEAIRCGQSMKDFIVNTMQKVMNKDVAHKDFTKELQTSMKANDSILEELAHK
jgi:hypothetical protein